MIDPSDVDVPCMNVVRDKDSRVKSLASKKQEGVCFFGLTSCFFKKSKRSKGASCFFCVFIKKQKKQEVMLIGTKNVFFCFFLFF